MKTRVTVETITQELDDAAALARRVEQPGAVIQAVQTKAKLHGLLIDRKETGQPGDFDGLKTEAEVVDAFRASHGDEAAAMLALLLAKTGAQAAPEPEQAPVETAKAGDTINQAWPCVWLPSGRRTPRDKRYISRPYRAAPQDRNGIWIRTAQSLTDPVPTRQALSTATPLLN